jgi:cbb3-type cytochrome oxidase subunit 1
MVYLVANQKSSFWHILEGLIALIFGVFTTTVYGHFGKHTYVVVIGVFSSFWYFLPKKSGNPVLFGARKLLSDGKPLTFFALMTLPP